MKINKSIRENSDMTSFKKFYEYYSTIECKNDFFITCFELNNENYKWNCLDCGLMLTSESQAREHFLGKKHQNVLKNKTFYNSFIDITKTSPINCLKTFSNSSDNILSESSRIQSLRKNYFNVHTHGKNNFQNIVPPPELLLVNIIVNHVTSQLIHLFNFYNILKVENINININININ
ncbi:hypothetical protein Phum_PHUM401570 [Pediculus humanus corporis]|uniref:C2H2-type domain-containing protein n=1 Tax=Pediculus humanus subsp. corporis TaxID=121224 RepID=E0VRQ7_PEDHC|nr:uncharacterized protein Phum_PHUM401570 [Pediculus humanus corporis]EEB16063.1 hypothetical protein Phum_PHUM401570 [Pediculus humanus corporis]